ncbi:hypothetical protein Tco_1046498 [Tanacetum coccineum]
MILKRVCPVAYTLELPEELSNVHSTFHISNLKKCISDKSLVILMKELRLDDKLNFMEEPVEIIDREVKQLRESRIPIVKIRWNSKEDQSLHGNAKIKFVPKYSVISWMAVLASATFLVGMAPLESRICRVGTSKPL